MKGVVLAQTCIQLSVQVFLVKERHMDCRAPTPNCTSHLSFSSFRECLTLLWRWLNLKVRQSERSAVLEGKSSAR